MSDDSDTEEQIGQQHTHAAGVGDADDDWLGREDDEDDDDQETVTHPAAAAPTAAAQVARSWLDDSDDEEAGSDDAADEATQEQEPAAAASKPSAAAQWKNWLDDEEDDDEDDEEDEEFEGNEQKVAEKEKRLVEEPEIEDESGSEEELEDSEEELEDSDKRPDDHEGPTQLHEADEAELRAQQQAWLDDDSDAEDEEVEDDDEPEKRAQQPKQPKQPKQAAKDGDLKDWLNDSDDDGDDDSEHEEPPPLQVKIPITPADDSDSQSDDQPTEPRSSTASVAGRQPPAVTGKPTDELKSWLDCDSDATSDDEDRGNKEIGSAQRGQRPNVRTIENDDSPAADTAEVFVVIRPDQKPSFHDDWLNRESEDDVPAEVTLPSGVIARKMSKEPRAQVTTGSTPLANDDSDGSDVEDWLGDMNPTAGHEATQEDLNDWHEEDPSENMTHTMRVARKKLEDTHGEHAPYFLENIQLYTALLRISDLRFDELDPLTQKSLMESLEVKRYAPDEIIVQEGDESSEFYLLLGPPAAEVLIRKTIDGAQQNITRLHRGQYFGQRHFTTRKQQTRNATAAAITEVEVACVRSEHFHLWTHFRTYLLMKEVPMLRTLPDQEQRAMQKNLQMQEFADGDYIVRQGEYGDKFYIITEGSAMVIETIAHADGTLQDVVLTQLYEGHFFGEMALIYEEPRVASVCAAGRTTCMYLTKEAFRSALTAQQFQIMMQEISYKRVTTREMRLRTRTASEHPHGSPSISQAKTVRQSVPRTDEAPHQQDDQTERAQLAVQMTNILVRTRLNTGDRLINKYLIMEELGRGSYGGVYLCRNEETGQLYAMKMLTRSARHGKQLTETIRQEIAVMKKLRHPNIVTLHEVIDDPAANQVFLVQEYMEGGTVMNDAFGEPISPFKARAYFRDMLQGVMYLHSVGVVHRDIKPQNMLLTADGVVKLADFGTAVFNSDTSEYIKAGGTPAYMAPELFAENSAARVASPKVDIWSLGATLFNLVVGRPPWVAANQIVLAHQIQHVELSFPPEAEDLDPHLKNLLRRMLTKDPDRRIALDDIINHEWVTDEGADPLVDVKALRPAMLKQQSVQVTEFEVQQAVVMPPSVMSLLKRKLAAARNKFSRAFHDRGRSTAADKHLRTRSERERESIGESEPPTPSAEALATPPTPATRAGARGKFEAMRPRQVENPHRRGSWNFFGSSADNSPVGTEPERLSTPSKPSNSPAARASEQDALKPHRHVPPLAIRAPPATTKRRASLQPGVASGSTEEDLPSPLFIEKRDSESSAPSSARTTRGSGSSHMRKSMHSTRSMHNVRGGKHRRAQTNDGNLPKLSDAELEVLRDQKLFGNLALAPKEVLSLHSPAVFPSPPTTPRSRTSHCTADSDNSHRDSNCSYHSALVIPEELDRRHSTISLRSDASHTSAHPAFFDAQSSPNDGAAPPMESPAIGSKRLQRKHDFIMVPTGMAKDLATGTTVRQAVVLVSKGVTTTRRPSSSTKKPKAHIPELDSSSDESEELEGEIDGGDLTLDRHGSYASSVAAAQALEATDSNEESSSDASVEDAEGLEGDDVEVVGDTEMNLIFEELCADDSDEVDDPDLQPMPLPEEKRQKLFELRTWANQVNLQLGLRYGVAQAKGPRPYMEDRSTVVGSLLAAATGTSPSKSPRSRSPAPARSLGPDFAFAAIYDGHNGDDVAEQLKAEFHRIVYNRLRAQCSEPSENLESLLATALETACREMDERILSKEHAIQQDLWLQAEDDDDPRALVSRVQSSAGATCAFAVVVSEGLHPSSKARFLAVANVGDCRVVLSVDGNATNLTSDHKPAREDEKQRIQQAGGWVHKGRLGGILAVSRAFGDSAYKTYPTDDLWGTHQQLISRPGVQVLEIADDFEFVIIASDGLWDVLPSELAVNYVRRRLAYHGDVQRATTELITKAEELGTGDNVSAVVCCLNQVKQQSRPFGASKTTIFGSSKQNMTLAEHEKQRQSSTNSSSSERTALLAAEPVPRHEEKTPIKARRASLTALLKGVKADDAASGGLGDDADAQLTGRHSTSSSTKPKKGMLGLFGKSGARNG